MEAEDGSPRQVGAAVMGIWGGGTASVPPQPVWGRRAWGYKAWRSVVLLQSFSQATTSQAQGAV